MEGFPVTYQEQSSAHPTFDIVEDTIANLKIRFAEQFTIIPSSGLNDDHHPADTIKYISFENLIFCFLFHKILNEYHFVPEFSLVFLRQEDAINEKISLSGSCFVRFVRSLLA